MGLNFLELQDSKLAAESFETGDHVGSHALVNNRVLGPEIRVLAVQRITRLRSRSRFGMHSELTFRLRLRYTLLYRLERSLAKCT